MWKEKTYVDNLKKKNGILGFRRKFSLSEYGFSSGQTILLVLFFLISTFLIIYLIWIE